MSRAGRITRWLGIVLCAVAAAVADAQVEGSRKWRFNLGAPVYSSPALAADGSIYVGAESTLPGRLFAIQPNGITRWQFIGATDWFDATPAVGDDGAVYAGSWDNRFFALNQTGATRLRWFYAADGFIASSAAIAADGTLYFGSGDRSFHALNPNGTLKWNYPLLDWVDSSPAIGPDGTIYFGCWDNFVYALRPDGTLRWTFETGDNVTSSPAIGADGTVYIGSADGKVYALHGATGAKRWEYGTGAGVSASPIVGDDGNVYVGSLDGYFYALDRGNGALVWRVYLGAEIISSAALRADNVLIVGVGYEILALNPGGGVRWRHMTGDYVDSSPVIAPDGTIYVGSADGWLYALNGNGQGPSTSSPWPMFRRDARRQGRAPAGTLVTPVTVTLGALHAYYDGQPKPVSIATDPAGVQVAVTYNGAPEPPVAAGSYAVEAAVQGADYSGGASGTLVISPAGQTIAFELPGEAPFGFEPLALNATSSSGLPVTYAVLSGPALLQAGALVWQGPGSVTVRAMQGGDANHQAAAPVDRMVVVRANFDSWLAEHFSPAELADPVLTGPGGTPAGDGWNNLLKYALGLPPHAPVGAAAPIAAGADEDWIFSYARPAGRTDVGYTVEVSADLVTWTTQGVTLDPVETADGWELCRARHPRGSAARLFFRLRVSR